MAVLDEGLLAVSVTDIRALQGRPGKVTFRLTNHSSEPLEFIKSALEVQRRLPRGRHALPTAGRGYAVVTAIEPGMTIAAFGELPVIFNIDRRTGFGGLIPVEPPLAQEPHLYFAARLFYRRSTGELFETGVYRRLRYPNLSFSEPETAHAHLNYAGSGAFVGVRKRPDAPVALSAS